ncbi:hypothetical protein GCM10010174_90750 [Kutzneria viridogrisea]|uniref:Uncharacterized protein n=2 Tax=Kutzneria TaxID=43356 RepID=A0ABR6BWP1_9PSEU|nr:hypothetical protein [Kutzneria albida]AHH93870.1 putative membrane protein [Kutzneria albida DSM 43870]MBA8931125.1 hypothetical protein [Kutzneria viridogrisea]
MTVQKSTYDLLMTGCVLVGVHEGVVPIVMQLCGWGFHALAFPVLLPTPWMWTVSVLAILAAFAGLWYLDEAKKRAYPAGAES